MNRTDIEYLDYTWNPLAMRCTPVSEGCAHCWHIRMTKRLAGNDRFPDEVRAAYAGNRRPLLIEKRLDEPSRLRKPSRIGVQFMGDLFHEDVNEWNQSFDVLSVCKRNPQHTFLILTKRPRVMKEVLDSWYLFNHEDYPLPNIWLGVTAENQQRADERIPLLLQCPAAVRLVSVEPMLGAVALNEDWFAELGYYRTGHGRCEWCGWFGCSCGRRAWEMPVLDEGDHGVHPHLSWVIIGGETGPGARPMDPDWARSIRDQCKAAGVPYFFKQMSNKDPIPDDLMVREWPE